MSSAEAEQAAATIMGELASFRLRRKAELLSKVGRVFFPRLGTGSVPLAYSSVVISVSVAESFFAAVLQTRIDDAFNVTSRLMKDAQKTAVGNVDSTWPNRQTSAKRWFGVDFAADMAVKEMLIFAEVRNAIAHGVGRLTRRQLGTDQGRATIATMASVGVRLHDSVVEIDDDAVTRCSLACRRAVLWMDEAMAAAQLVAAGDD